MARFVLPLLVFVFATSLGVAAPVPKTLKKKVESLAGTTWVGQEDGFGRVSYTFEANGVLVYSYRGSTWRDASWTQDGETVTFEINKRFSEFSGAVIDGVLSGERSNKNGLRWPLTVTRE